MLSIVAFTALTPYVAATAGEMEAPLEMDDAILAALEELHIVQAGLEWFRQETGSYPTTAEWVDDNVLEDYVGRAALYDPWQRKLEYEGVEENGVVVNDRLQSRGRDYEDPVDTVPCPVDANKHCFSPISDFEFQPLIPDEQTRAAIVAGMNPVFSISARHPIAGATLLWVLDGKPIDETYQDHTVRRELSEGEHVLRVIDHEGRQAVAMLSPPSIEETVAGDQS